MTYLYNYPFYRALAVYVMFSNPMNSSARTLFSPFLSRVFLIITSSFSIPIRV